MARRGKLILRAMTALNPQQRHWMWVFLPYGMILMAYLAGMVVDLIEIDATQYATMSRQMFQTGDYLHIWDKGRSYLDKPPLVFWMASLSYKLFGVSGWAYKLPSVLFSIWAIYGTDRLGRLLYGRRAGYLSGLILGSCQAFFLMNNDVKTDMYLIAPMVVGLWLLLRWSREGRRWDWVAGAACLGLGMLGKGPMALIAPGMAIGADLLLRRDWVTLWKPQWLLVVPIALVVTTPFLVGLYQQHGGTGVLFFLWTQSFGRVTGQSEWSNDATAFFFVHSMAWSFLPWTAMFLVALGRRIWAVGRAGFRIPAASEGVTLAGFVLVFLALCFSRFKLPHYIFVTYPFASVMVAAFWVETLEGEQGRSWARVFVWIQSVVAVLVLLIASALAFWAFPESGWAAKLAFLLLAAGLVVAFARESRLRTRLLIATVMAFSVANLLLAWGIYPALMPYQTTSVAGKMVSKLGEDQEVYAFIVSGRGLDFYAPHDAKPVPRIDDLSVVTAHGPVLIYTDTDGLNVVRDNGFRHEVLGEWPHHSPSKLTLPFLNPATRASHVKPRYLLRVSKP